MSIENRNGVRWSSDEDKLLLSELKQNLDISNIAEAHKRTVYAIQCRFMLLAYYELNNGATKEAVVQKFKLQEEEFDKFVHEKQTYKPRKKTQTEALERRIEMLEALVLSLQEQFNEYKASHT